MLSPLLVSITLAIITSFRFAWAGPSDNTDFNAKDLLTQGICGNTDLQLFDSPPFGGSTEFQYPLQEVWAAKQRYPEGRDDSFAALYALASLERLDDRINLNSIIGMDYNNCLGFFQILGDWPTPSDRTSIRVIYSMEFAGMAVPHYPPGTTGVGRGNAIWALVFYDTIKEFAFENVMTYLGHEPTPKTVSPDLSDSDIAAALGGHVIFEFTSSSTCPVGVNTTCSHLFCNGMNSTHMTCWYPEFLEGRDVEVAKDGKFLLRDSVTTIWTVV